jgi:alpha-beta hydrolase superfamily lysophospholipase
MRAEPFHLQTDDGVELYVHRWLPEGRARGIVEIAHGMAEHAGRYERFAAALTDRGWAVYGPDHRGHGRTAKSPEALGHFADENGWDLVLSDLRRVAHHARREHPSVPLVLFGHSMGSYLAQTLILKHPQEFDGLVLSGTQAGGGALVRVGYQIAKLERMRKGRRARSEWIHRMSFDQFNRGFEGRTRFDWLSRDPVEVDRYASDERCGFRCSNQLWIDLLGGLDKLGRADWSRLPKELPIYVFGGEHDPVGGRGRGVRKLVSQLRAAGLTRVTEVLYPEGRHEMLNEINRDEVVGALLRWLDERFPPSR